MYNKDIRESTTNVLDSSGVSQVSYEYSDFGETEITGDEEFYNEICYSGGIYDESTGIYYLNARYYDPEAGIFLTQDSYRGEYNDPLSLNLYAYCKGNPITYTDPSGHFPIVAAAIWAYRGYKVIKTARAVYKTAKTVKKVYRVAKTINKLSKAKKAYKVVNQTKKVVRAAKKVKKTKNLTKLVRKSTKSSRKNVVSKPLKKKKVSSSKSSSKKWKVGDSITKKTKNGKPSWSTVRARYWKNEAAKNGHKYSSRNLERMRKGKAPQRFNNKTGKYESRELHHKIPRRCGGSNSKRNLKQVWPEEHASIDRYRHV